MGSEKYEADQLNAEVITLSLKGASDQMQPEARLINFAELKKII